ncbi:MAG: hypothetical protein HYS83_02120 [Candidatus Blackburnbacteria bacterium]|nr:hypothetical protein [Candidatus Blackburnbacteria bacterium]
MEPDDRYCTGCGREQSVRRRFTVCPGCSYQISYRQTRIGFCPRCGAAMLWEKAIA